MVAPAKWRRKSGALGIASAVSKVGVGDSSEVPIKIEVVEEKLSWGVNGMLQFQFIV